VRLTDVDGVTYLDFTLAWGPLILGHSHPKVVDAVRAQLERGTMFGAQHALEAAVAERVQAAVPCADLVTFSSSGTEIVQVALRLARAYTGRPKIVKFEGHYHGWSDAALVSYHPALDAMGPREAPVAVPGSAGQAHGAYADMLLLPWNDTDALAALLAQHGEEIAAVIMEPVLCNSGVLAPLPGYLEAARELTSRYGAVLIFDEVITGFRLAMGGAQEVYNVVPDLATYAKAIAAGFPLSAIAGRQAIMDLITHGLVKHSGSYNGNPISLAAAGAALDELGQPGVFARLNRLGAALAEGARALVRRHKIAARVHQAGPVMQILFTEQEDIHDYRGVAACDADRSAALVEALREQGVLILPDGRWYLATVHDEGHVKEALAALDASLSRLAHRSST
jgi:glutamate-1-semialdehyde 2,1-aminomutase